MKIKNFTKILLVQFAIVVFAAFAFGQSESESRFPSGESSIGFANGITVAQATDYGNVKQFRSYSNLSSDNELIYHKTFINDSNKTFTGYDLEIIPQTDLKKFKLIIKPLSTKPESRANIGQNYTFIPLPKYMGEILIDDGDIISLDIFENLKTKEKITDYVIITRSKSTGPRFASKRIPRDFTLDDVQIRLDNFEIKINDKSFYKSNGSGSGNNIAIYLPGKGRFIMSPFSREGYPFQKIGTITNNELTFSYGGEDYKIISQSPILGLGGKWHCWILFEPNYIPNKKDGFGSGSGVIVQSGNIEGMFDN